MGLQWNKVILCIFNSTTAANGCIDNILTILLKAKIRRFAVCSLTVVTYLSVSFSVIVAFWGVLVSFR